MIKRSEVALTLFANVAREIKHKDPKSLLMM